jgi:Na+/H+ antiporter NhaB
MVIVLITAFTGITDEHRLGRAFQDAMPFTALLVVFFAVVAVIHQQQLFSPLIAGCWRCRPSSSRACCTWPTACCRRSATTCSSPPSTSPK